MEQSLQLSQELLTGLPAGRDRIARIHPSRDFIHVQEVLGCSALPNEPMSPGALASAIGTADDNRTRLLRHKVF